MSLRHPKPAELFTTAGYDVAGNVLFGTDTNTGIDERTVIERILRHLGLWSQQQAGSENSGPGG